MSPRPNSCLLLRASSVFRGNDDLSRPPPTQGILRATHHTSPENVLHSGLCTTRVVHGGDSRAEPVREGRSDGPTAKDARPAFDRRLQELAYPPRVVPAYETLSNHLWNHLGEWFTFLDHPEIEATNWEAEQAIRPAVVNRKVWGGNRTWVGARVQEVLMSVLETCRRLGRGGLEFVSETLRAFGNPVLLRPVLLAPAN